MGFVDSDHPTITYQPLIMAQVVDMSQQGGPIPQNQQQKQRLRSLLCATPDFREFMASCTSISFLHLHFLLARWHRVACLVWCIKDMQAYISDT